MINVEKPQLAEFKFTKNEALGSQTTAVGFVKARHCTNKTNVKP